MASPFSSSRYSFAITIGCFITGSSLFGIGAYLSFVNIAPQQARAKARTDYIKQLLQNKLDTQPLPQPTQDQC
ncbi:hypothetical protein GIB67_013703 [Kingdonia uniflora]|uniref:Uncharacterized protein n=1 Tax=Kingdonia uniflora TaxID=39325 RepID=A0A7J7NQA4_9MAGN|nr:hypothetical protein GIB67_013703 [Kingdonia uniflora]